jgi:hypothetical protein
MRWPPPDTPSPSTPWWPGARSPSFARPGPWIYANQSEGTCRSRVRGGLGDGRMLAMPNYALLRPCSRSPPPARGRHQGASPAWRDRGPRNRMICVRQPPRLAQLLAAPIRQLCAVMTPVTRDRHDGRSVLDLRGCSEPRSALVWISGTLLVNFGGNRVRAAWRRCPGSCCLHDRPAVAFPSSRPQDGTRDECAAAAVAAARAGDRRGRCGEVTGQAGAPAAGGDA